MWLPSLKALRALEAVARHMSFREAASELNVTPAAVQQLVRGLEASLDVPLVTRRGRTIGLTPAAASGVQDLHLALELFRDAVAKMRTFEPSQQLTVSVEPSFASTWLVGKLGRFQARYPNIEILIDASFRLSDLNRGQADIAIRYEAAAAGDLESRRLFEDETIAVCSPALVAGGATALTVQDLRHFTLIHFEWPHSPRLEPDWAAWLSAVGAKEIQAAGNLRFTDYVLALQAAIAGQGIALVSRPLVQEALSAGLLVAPFKESVRNGCGYDVVTSTRFSRRSDVAAFIDWILAEAE
jgi:LysR family glycine cleavage system transcriptional activator